MKVYRHFRLWVWVIGAAFAGSAGAQQDITGTWAGDLAVGPDTNLAIHFVLSRAAGGAYSALVTSPDMGGVKDVAASAVSFDGKHLLITVDELSGAYDGMLEGATLTGEWRQEGTAIPLVLSPYEEPVLTQAAIEFLTGEWSGKLETPVGSLAIVTRFMTNAEGELVGMLDSPDQGARDIPITDIVFAEGSLSFNVPRVRGVYKATASGDSLTGSWSQGGPESPLVLARGGYAPTVAALALSADAMTRLGGAWKGQLGPLEIVIRIETADTGEPVGFLDVPAQGAKDVKVTEASLDGDALVLRIAPIGASYTATLTGSELTGQWQQGPANNPLTLTRE